MSKIVPHGGEAEPEDIPIRKLGVVDPDGKTIQLSRFVYQALLKIFSKSNRKPHMIINHLHRTRIDQNRKREGGEMGFADTLEGGATQTYDEFHNSIAKAKESVLKQFGSGHLFDLHGQSHAEMWTEGGFGLPIDLLYLNDNEFNSQPNKGTVANLSKQFDFSEIIRGPKAIGTILHEKGWRSIPSKQIPNPGNSRNQYFNGGFIVRYYGSTTSGTLDSTQLEVARNVRNDETIEKFGNDLALSIVEFMNHFYPNLLSKFE